MSISFIHSLDPLLKQYDAFIIDLWGVIHDGMECYPGSKEALNYLHQHGKEILFLSNAPRRAIKAQEGLRRFNIPDTIYDGVITSGEIVFDLIKHQKAPLDDITGNCYLEVGPARDHGLLEALGYVSTTNVKKADFIITTGYDNDESPLDEKMPLLQEAIKRNLIMICTNPDLEIVRISGQRAYCAGMIAQQYTQLGGVVHSIGKPESIVYEYCINAFTTNDKKKICAIGDNIDTDIKGANTVNIDSVLIAGGMMSSEFNLAHGVLPDEEDFIAYCKNRDIFPTYGLAAFSL